MAGYNNGNNLHEDDLVPPGLLLPPAPLKGAVGTTGGSSSGGEKENQLAAGVTSDPDAPTGEQPGGQPVDRGSTAGSPKPPHPSSETAPNNLVSGVTPVSSLAGSIGVALEPTGKPENN